MDYLESSTDVSLQHLCAFKIVSHILIRCRGVRKSMLEFGDKEIASINFDELNLPKHFKNLLRDYVPPILDQLITWYCGDNINPTNVEPVFTWCGTLDETKMAKKVVENEGHPVLVRFALACTFCIETHIPMLMKRLKNCDLAKLSYACDAEFSVARLWLTKFEEVVALRKGENLLRVLDSAFLLDVANLVLWGRGDVVFKYLENVPLDGARELICDKLGKDFDVTFSPSTFRRLFAKLSPTQQKDRIGLFSGYILLAYLRWPYRGRFLDESQSLVDNLDRYHFGRILDAILRNIMFSKDYDYSQLLYCFWKLGWERKIDFFRDPTTRDKHIIERVHSSLLTRKDFGLIKHTFSCCPSLKRNCSDEDDEDYHPVEATSSGDGSSSSHSSSDDDYSDESPCSSSSSEPVLHIC